jgi:hypothetical protein
MAVWLLGVGGPRIEKFVQQFFGAVCHAECIGAVPGSDFLVGLTAIEFVVPAVFFGIAQADEKAGVAD